MPVVGNDGSANHAQPSPQVTLETICVRVLKRCNLICGHCWAASSPHEVEELRWLDVSTFLRRLVATGLKHVSISGGEPFLYGDLPRAIHESLDMGLHVTVTTNGYMGHRYARRMETEQLPTSPKLRVRVSLDGSEEIHDKLRGAGSYKRAIDAIAAIRNHHGWVGVNTVLLSQPQPSLTSLCVALRDLRVNDWALMAPLPKGHFRGKIVDAKAACDSVDSARLISKQVGFRGRIRFWNFLIREHGHLVLESDGRLVMPGYTEATDKCIGDFRSVSTDALRMAVIHDANLADCEFYTWGGWRPSVEST
jgi:pyruvate-formate lyase-activating enzyme